jgi:hypothetical protein
MKQMPNFNTAIVRNIQNNDLYEYLGNNKFRNLRTLKEGNIDEETAQRIFNINMESTILISQYPMIKELINTLRLKIEF